MAPSNHEEDVLSRLEQDISSTAPRLARRLASHRRRTVRHLLERAMVLIGWTTAALGVVLLFSFPDMPALVEVGLVLIGSGAVTATALSSIRHLAEKYRQRSTPPRVRADGAP
jgi:hypothetical protein